MERPARRARISAPSVRARRAHPGTHPPPSIRPQPLQIPSTHPSAGTQSPRKSGTFSKPRSGTFSKPIDSQASERHIAQLGSVVPDRRRPPFPGFASAPSTRSCWVGSKRTPFPSVPGGGSTTGRTSKTKRPCLWQRPGAARYPIAPWSGRICDARGSAAVPRERQTASRTSHANRAALPHDVGRDARGRRAWIHDDERAGPEHSAGAFSRGIQKQIGDLRPETDDEIGEFRGRMGGIETSMARLGTRVARVETLIQTPWSRKPLSRRRRITEAAPSRASGETRCRRASRRVAGWRPILFCSPLLHGLSSWGGQPEWRPVRRPTGRTGRRSQSAIWEVSDGSFAAFGRDAGLKTGAPSLPNHRARRLYAGSRRFAPRWRPEVGGTRFPLSRAVRGRTWKTPAGGRVSRGAAVAAPRGVPVDGDRGSGDRQVIVSSRR